MKEKNQQAVENYLANHQPKHGLYAIAKLLIYALEHKDHIHLDDADTDSLKGTIELLKNLN
jgi:hypothetical protein